MKEPGTSKKVVILGAGRRGMGMAKQLITDGKDVVILDNSFERVEMAVSKLDCLGVLGNGTDIDKLTEAGVEQAEAFIAVTNSDEINLVSCGLVSSSFPNTKTVAAIRSLIYTGSGGLKEGLLGIDYIVNPNAETARSIFTIIEHRTYALNPSHTFPTYAFRLSRPSEACMQPIYEVFWRFTGA